MITPPDFAIRAAAEAGLRSPCAKSKRGAAVISPAGVFGTGWNAQPEPYVCTGSDACRAACGKLCVHAEARAIRDALRCPAAVYMARRGPGSLVATLRGLELVHAKVVDGQLVAGGGPSCWQCSREILDAGIEAVWLYEAQRWHHEIPCDTCNAVTIIAQHAGSTGACERCKVAGRWPGLLEFDREKTVYEPDSGEWHHYTARDFYAATAAHHSLPLEVRR